MSLRDQLENLKKQRSTIIPSRKNTVTFIEDDTVDSYTLLDLIGARNSYINERALAFERQSLSPVEEKKFNSKFAEFLKTLLTNNPTDEYEHTIEFLIRIYSIDMYNTAELVYLTLPHRKYEKQLAILLKNTPLSYMRQYSHLDIARIMVKNSRFARILINYYKNYEILSRFCDNLMDEIIEILKNSETEFLNEMHEIFTILIAKNRPETCLQIYHRLKNYLDNEEFKKLLLQFYDIDEINMTQCRRADTRSYEEIIHANGTERHLLNNWENLRKYAMFLQKNGLKAREFSDDEMDVLNAIIGDAPNISSKEKYKNNEKFIEAIKSLYREMGYKLPLTKLAMEVCPEMHSDLCVLMNDEDKICAFNMLSGSQEWCEIVQLLTSTNHRAILRNQPETSIKKNYIVLLEKCADFIDFDSELFCKLYDSSLAEKIAALIDENTLGDENTLVDENTVGDESPLRTANILKVVGADLQRMLISKTPAEISKKLLRNKTVLVHLLRDNTAHSMKTYRCLCEIVLQCCDSDVLIAASHYLSASSNQSIIEIEKFCNHLENVGKILFAAPLVSKCIVYLDTDFIFMYYLETGCTELFPVLVDRQLDVVSCLYNLKKYDFIFEISKSFAVDKVLILHENTIEFVDEYKEKLPMSQCIPQFIINNYLEKNYLEKSLCKCTRSLKTALKCLIYYSSLLTLFRSYSSWNILKEIIKETPGDKEETVLYIADNIAQFQGDRDLFYKIIPENYTMASELIKKILGTDNASLGNPEFLPAADFIDVCIEKSGVIGIDSIPFVAPLLISHRKRGVESLFQKYTRVMGVYSPSIVNEFLDAVSVLKFVDPRHAIKALCDDIEKHGSISDTNRFEIVKNSLFDILGTSESASKEALKSISRCLDTCSEMFDEEMTRIFLEYYFRSFENAADLGVHDGNLTMNRFLYRLLQKKEDVFCAIGDEFLHRNHTIFNLSSKKLLEAPRNLTDSNLSFLSKYLKQDVLHGDFQDAQLENTDASPVCIADPFALFKCIYSQCFQDSSLDFFGSLCKKCPEIQCPVFEYLEQALKTAGDAEKMQAIKTLDSLFSDVQDFMAYKPRIVPTLLILSEQNSEDLRGKARSFYEKLQFK